LEEYGGVGGVWGRGGWVLKCLSYGVVWALCVGKGPGKYPYLASSGGGKSETFPQGVRYFLFAHLRGGPSSMTPPRPGGLAPRMGLAFILFLRPPTEGSDYRLAGSEKVLFNHSLLNPVANFDDVSWKGVFSFLPPDKRSQTRQIFSKLPNTQCSLTTPSLEKGSNGRG